MRKTTRKTRAATTAAAQLANNEQAQLETPFGNYQVEKRKEEQELQVCDFCGKSLENVSITSSSNTSGSSKRNERRKFCSERCRSRAERGWTAVRLGMPTSKRRLTTLKFSNPLYFD
jgi:ribosomal protein L34E